MLTVERIRRRVAVDDNGCWIWQGYINPQTGYGQVHVNASDPIYEHRTMTAPRVVLLLTVGPADGLQVRHHCDVAACCNPDHLAWGTPLENSADARERGRLRVGEDHPQAIHSNATVARAKAMLAAGSTRREIADELDVNYWTVCSWLQGKIRTSDSCTVGGER